MSKADWVWMPHAGHLIISHQCRFHVATKVGNYIVSTVGEWWPERPAREIHAKIHDPQWLAGNIHRRGDDFDAAYMERFGFETVGYDRIYESMVFKAMPSEHVCCPWRIESGENIDGCGYNDAGEAYRGHLELCEKWEGEP